MYNTCQVISYLLGGNVCVNNTMDTTNNRNIVMKTASAAVI